MIGFRKKDGKVYAVLSGRIDSSNAPEAEAELLQGLEGVEEPVFDLEKLEYISSAGLRVLMKVRKRSGKALEMIGASQEIYEILETTGFTELFKVSKKMREISVEGCPVIGKGFYGTVYRIDEETIVKVYSSPDCLDMIRNEKKLARTALVAGVPTAISYDIVKVGDSYGSVFELLNAVTFGDMLAEQPENCEAIVKQYAEFMRLVNSQSLPQGKLRSAKEIFSGYLEAVRGLLDEALYLRLKKLLMGVPEQNTLIHGDAQMKNIMIGNGEPMLIDMDTLCQGHPIFDLQSVFVTYFAFEEDDPDNSMSFLGVSNQVAEKVWRSFPGYYFATGDQVRLSQLWDKISIVGCIRFLFLIHDGSEDSSGIYSLRVKHTVERLRALSARVDDLRF